MDFQLFCFRRLPMRASRLSLNMARSTTFCASFSFFQADIYGGMFNLFSARADRSCAPRRSLVCGMLNEPARSG